MNRFIPSGAPMSFTRLITWTFGMFTVLASAVDGGAFAADEGLVRVYIGTYTGSTGAGETSKGIYLSQLNPDTGALSKVELAAEVKNPSFLAIHPNHKFLYAVNEVSDSDGKPTGAVSAFAIDATSGKLKLLNQQSSQGAGPCHLVVDRTGQNVLVANYGAGSCACLPIGADGQLRDATAAIQHRGKGSNPQRQAGPHAHSINLDPSNRYAFCADLGWTSLIYSYDPAKDIDGKRSPAERRRRFGTPRCHALPGGSPTSLTKWPAP